MSIEAMRLALDALQDPWKSGPDGVANAITALRAAIEHYDQTSLELCEKCGWKAIIPSEGCLVCARQKAPVAWMYDFMADNRDEVIRDWMTQDYDDIKREHGFNVRPLYTAPQYDQTALELCEECGWKAIIPGDGCLVCARQKAKPVAYVDSRIHGWPDCFVMEPDPPHTVPLYTEPREWVELTEEEVNDCIKLPNRNLFARDGTTSQRIARAIEAKLKEKNSG
jgi:hypothetical protein